MLSSMVIYKKSHISQYLLYLLEGGGEKGLPFEKGRMWE